MPTVNTVLPENDWVEVQVGPAASLIGCRTNLEYAYMATKPPATFAGHPYFAWQGNFRAAPLAGESCWMRSRNEGALIIKTPEV